MSPAPHIATADGGAVSGLRRVLANLAKLLGGKAAAGLISLIYLVLATRRLGVTDYGVLVLVNAYAVLIGSVVAFSGFHGVVRYGAIALEAGDRAGFARLVRFMAVIEVGCGVVAVLVAAILAPVVGPHLGWSPRTIALATIYALAVVGTVRATPQGVLQIAGRFDLLGLHQAVSPLVRLIGATGVWVTGGGLYGFIAVWLASAIAEGAAMWLLALPAWRQLAEGERVRGPWREPQGEGFLRFILVTNADITIRELAPNLAPLTVGWLLGPPAAGLLALAQRATSLLAQPTVLLSHASYSVLTEQVARREIGLFKRTVSRSTALALLVAAPIVLALAFGGERLMVLIGGSSFAGGTLLLILIAAARAAGLASAPLAAGLTALGRPQRSMAVGLATNLLMYPLLPLLLWTTGADGAGWHALAQGWVGLIVLAMLFRRDAADEEASDRQ
ncbi:Membrane protein involved in the export of O-antigen and teichoic acid [Sphingomonas gellani]|uniref:Membrane protein involved in the export of O-antigen and teichoic acid n=1 Tax=Sphingomonas gellani TaxID=1166340 RepID=A0A1H8B2M4_9SPHN|nr:lipopolysaccharide biosynthesis protein [Sphingomonas gellani]SEM76344.1 Membrane protein involved in the export of O-antigen and teichoic acid [Sphingomonas gellani]